MYATMTEFAFRGDRLRRAREARGLTQAELERAIGAGANQIVRYEKGKMQPTSTVIIRMAQVLGVSADYLLGLTDSPTAELTEASLSAREKELIFALRSFNPLDAMRLLLEEADENRRGHESTTTG